MYVFKDDRVIEFDGELSADTLVEFLLDVSGKLILLLFRWVISSTMEGRIAHGIYSCRRNRVLVNDVIYSNASLCRNSIHFHIILPQRYFLLK